MLLLRFEAMMLLSSGGYCGSENSHVGTFLPHNMSSFSFLSFWLKDRQLFYLCCGVRELFEEHLFKSSGFIKTSFHGPPHSLHSRTSSIWFLDHQPTGSVMVGTSDLSADVLFAHPQLDRSTHDKTTHQQIGYDHVNIRADSIHSHLIWRCAAVAPLDVYLVSFITRVFCHDGTVRGWMMEKVRAKRGIQGCGWWLLTKLL